jgi:hypothetical protein
MQTRRHTAIGKLVVLIGKKVAKKKAKDPKVKLGAAGIVALVLGSGLAAARK